MKSFAFAIVALALSPVALADDFRFAYTPEDLLSPAQFYSELDRAARRHCARINDIRDLPSIRVCHQNLVKIVVEEIDHPQLTAYEDSRVGNSRS